MIKQYFVPFKHSSLLSTVWHADTDRMALILPSAAVRSMAGIRYYAAIMANRLNKIGYNVVTFNYPGTGNSGLETGSIGLQDLIDAGLAVCDFYEERLQSSIDVFIGLAAGNWVAPILMEHKQAKQLILVNPDYDSVPQFVRNLTSQGREEQERYRELGYLESNFTTPNGSDATFSVLDMENPDDTLRFWEAITGPFYGGEDEIVYTGLIEDIKQSDILERLADNVVRTTVFYWGNWFSNSSLVRRLPELAKVDCGRVSNEKYWLDSSVLFDKSIASVVDYLTNLALEAKRDGGFSSRMNLYTECELEKGILVQALTLDTARGELAGLLTSPVVKPDCRLPVIIYEHGLGCDNVGEFRAWHTLSLELARLGYCSFRYDHIGSGVSGGDFDETTHYRYVEDLKNVIDSLSDLQLFSSGQFILVSWSFGANVSWMTAVSEPRISHLVLWSPVVDHGTATTKVKLFRNSKGSIVFPISPLWLPIEYLKAEKTIDMAQLLDNCQQPALLITGEEDNEILFSQVKEKIRGRDCDAHISVKNTGHCFSQSTISDVIQSTVSWIKQVSKADSVNQ